MAQSCELLSEHMHHTEWMPSLHHHSDVLAMKSTFISALCRQTPLGTWTKHEQAGHKQLLLVTWVTAALRMFVIQGEREGRKLLIITSIRQSARNEAYSIIKYWTYPVFYAWILFSLFFLFYSPYNTVELFHVYVWFLNYDWSILWPGYISMFVFHRNYRHFLNSCWKP